MIIKSIFLLPLLIIKKIYRVLIMEFNEIRNPKNKRYKELLSSYELTGLSNDRDNHIQHLNESLKVLGLSPYDEEIGMYSEHLLIFSAISKSNYKPKNILEIGTYDGKTAAILSKLFPESCVHTLDLDEQDIMFKNEYNRSNNTNEFVSNRDDLIDKIDNINFIKANSLHLTFSESLKKQDLIWVDGAHGYPIVCSDITNCLRLLNKGGILMCDDVWKDLKISDKMYSSIATFETLSSFSDARIITNTFFRKRIGKRYNGNYKYVSVSRLISDSKRLIN